VELGVRPARRALPPGDTARRAEVLKQVRLCFWELLKPDKPDITEDTKLTDLFWVEVIGQPLARALDDWFGRDPRLQAGLLAQALAYGIMSTVGDVVSWIVKRLP
jgi:hypothetical protein